MLPDTVAIYSGGMDSFTLVRALHSQSRLSACLSFDYGQRHHRELLFAQHVCRELRPKVEHHVIRLNSFQVLFGDSALTGGNIPVPEGHYAEESMKQTVVPNRNAIMLSLAVAFAISHKLSRVAYAAHAGDHTIYPDCRPEFVSAMNTVALLCDWHPVEIYAPYLRMTKGDILAEGLLMGLDYGRSWTCYKGDVLACGKCGSCRERLEAFEQNNARDPLPYEAYV